MQYLGTWVEQEATNPALVNALSTYVANPYAGVINTPGCGICGGTIQAGHLMRPYPQFSGASETESCPWPTPSITPSRSRWRSACAQGCPAHGVLHQRQVHRRCVRVHQHRLDRRILHRCAIPTTCKLERSLSEWDIPQVLQFSYIWQVPYGRGKHFGSNLNSIVDGFLGGWQTSGMWRFDNGQPISIGVTGASAPWGYAASYPDMIGKLKVNPKSQWFTNGYFANGGANALIVPAPYTIGNAPRIEPNARIPGTNNATLALFKDIPLHFREGAKLQIRAEVL